MTQPGILLSATMILAVAATPPPASGAQRAKRLLIVVQGPDGHPAGTHEYRAGARVLAACLRKTPNLEVTVADAEGDWAEGPSLLAKADSVVLFLAEGATWLHADPERLKAFAELAARGGGLVALHWAMGTKSAECVDGFVKLFGGCHGGPDRKYKLLETDVRVAAPDHPIARGLNGFRVRDEFYYDLKSVAAEESLSPILEAMIDGRFWPVAWAWRRPDGGRSFGFSGLHYHANWRLPQYRRLVAQAVLWTLGLPIPEKGLSVDIDEALLAPPAAKEPAAETKANT